MSRGKSRSQKRQN